MPPMLRPATAPEMGPEDRQIVNEAARWVNRIQTGELTPARKRELDDWLRMDVRHVAALDLALEAWDRAPEYAVPNQRVQPRFAKRIGNVFRPLSLGGFGAAAAVAAAIAALVVVLPPDRPAYSEYVTTGEAEQIAMKDGSQIALAPNSRIFVLSEDDARSVRLMKGTAAFDVRTNGTRFSVEAGEVTVVVTGTRFEVAHDRERTRVKLNEGSVRLTGEGFRDLELTSGDTAVYDPAKSKLTLTKADLGGSPMPRRQYGAQAPSADRAEGRRDRSRTAPPRLEFDSARLDRVVAEVETLTGRNFTLDSPDMASIAVSGTFSRDNAVATLRGELNRKGLALKDAGGRYVIVWDKARPTAEPAPTPADR